MIKSWLGFHHWALQVASNLNMEHVDGPSHRVDGCKILQQWVDGLSHDNPIISSVSDVRWCPSSLAKLVCKYFNVWVDSGVRSIVNGDYKLTYNWCAPPCSYMINRQNYCNTNLVFDAPWPFRGCIKPS